MLKVKKAAGAGAWANYELRTKVSEYFITSRTERFNKKKPKDKEKENFFLEKHLNTVFAFSFNFSSGKQCNPANWNFSK